MFFIWIYSYNIITYDIFFVLQTETRCFCLHHMQKGITSMNINECYQAMGADYEEVFGRLRNERLITKFVLKFPGDPSFSQLQSTLEEKNVEEAFRAAHTLKGVAQNLGFTRSMNHRHSHRSSPRRQPAGR